MLHKWKYKKYFFQLSICVLLVTPTLASVVSRQELKITEENDSVPSGHNKSHASPLTSSNETIVDRFAATSTAKSLADDGGAASSTKDGEEEMLDCHPQRKLRSRRKQLERMRDISTFDTIDDENVISTPPCLVKTSYSVSPPETKRELHAIPIIATSSNSKVVHKPILEFALPDDTRRPMFKSTLPDVTLLSPAQVAEYSLTTASASDSQSQDAAKPHHIILNERLPTSLDVLFDFLAPKKGQAIGISQVEFP